MTRETTRPTLLSLGLLLLLCGSLQAGPFPVESLLGDLDDFILANGRSQQAFGNRFNSPLRILVNNSLLAHIQGARGAVFDKTLEALRCELLVLLDLLAKSGPAHHRPVVANAIAQVDGIREAARSGGDEAKEPAPADPQSVPPPEDQCSIEVRRVAGPQVRRLLNGSFVLSGGTRLEFRAHGDPEGGQLEWEVFPDPGEFETGEFSSDNCSVCGAGRATFVAPSGLEGATSFRVLARYTFPSGGSCSDEVILFVR